MLNVKKPPPSRAGGSCFLVPTENFAFCLPQFFFFSLSTPPSLLLFYDLTLSPLFATRPKTFLAIFCMPVHATRRPFPPICCDFPPYVPPAPSSCRFSCLGIVFLRAFPCPPSPTGSASSGPAQALAFAFESYVSISHLFVNHPLLRSSCLLSLPPHARQLWFFFSA